MQRILEIAQKAAKAGGQELARFRGERIALEKRTKLDGSVVTAADGAASVVIRDVILAHDRDAFIVDEEDPTSHDRERPDRMWVVDPLDGTRTFASGRDGYCTLVGYVVDGVPRVGVIYFPDTKIIVYGGKGLGAWIDAPSLTRPTRLAGWSPEALENSRLFIPDKPEARELYKRLTTALGTNQLEGQNIAGAMYLALLRNACEFVITRMDNPFIWDIAAPHALLLAIGGDIVNLRGEPIDYQRTTLLEHGTIGMIHPHLLPQILERLPPLEQMRI